METLIQDVRVALRGFRKAPGFAAIAIACMALGIGANTAMWSVVEAVLLRPFPFADPDRIVALHRSRIADPSFDSFAYLDFADLERQLAAVAPVGAYASCSLTLGGEPPAPPARLAGQAVSAGLFPLLGAAPALGRGFRPADDRPGAPPAILLSDELWHRAFHADPGIVGRAISIDGAPRTVVGVMPPRFAFPSSADAWVPAAPLYFRTSRTHRELTVLARLPRGVAPADLRRALAGFARAEAAAFPAADAGWRVVTRPLRAEMLVPETPRVLRALVGAVIGVLLIACANVANLQLARGAGRQREVAVRFAFGAARRRILRQLITESLLLSLAGGVLGLLLAAAGTAAILAAIPPDHRAYWLHFDLDLPVLLFTFALAAGSGVLAGLAPAAGALRRNLSGLIENGGRSTAAAAAGGRGLRGALVVVEIALALVLLAGASLSSRSYLLLTRTSVGFDTAPLLTLRVFLSGPAYEDDAVKTRRVDDLVRRIEALPGVERAAASALVPLAGGDESAEVAIEGRPVAAGREPSAHYAGVTAHYFEALGAPLVAGRGFTEREAVESRPLAVVNSTFAAQHWPGASPLGRRFQLADTTHHDWFTVVGVVADFKADDNLRAPIAAAAYLPYPYLPAFGNGSVVRSQMPPAALAASVRRQVHAADGGLPVYRVATMERLHGDSAWTARLFGGIFVAFGALALLLAAIGVYGVLSYTVSQRQREIGVRIALGAHDRDVLRLVLGQALALTAAGIACGIAAAWGLAPAIGVILYRVNATDPVHLGVVALLLASVALLAGAVPARRALRADPLQILRQE